MSIIRIDLIRDSVIKYIKRKKSEYMRFMNFILGEKLEYIVVDDIQEATHWLAYEDDESIIKEDITAGKRYKLEYVKDAFWYDYFVKDDNDQYGMCYMVHKGDYIRVFKSNN